MAIIEGPLKQIMFLHMDAPNEAIPDGFVLCDGSTLNSTQQDINPGGNYTVPDLRNCFPLFADATKAFGTAAVALGNANMNLAAGAPGPGGTGGAHNHTLSTAELPVHSHPGNASGGSITLTDPGHSHTLTDPGHSHTLTDAGHSHTGSSNTVADHNHGINDPGHLHTVPFFIGTAGAGSVGSLAQSGGPVNTTSATTGISINNAGAHSHTVTVGSSTTGITLASRATGVTLTGNTTGITASLSGLTITGGNTGSGNAFDMRPRYYGLVAIIRVKA